MTARFPNWSFVRNQFFRRRSSCCRCLEERFFNVGAPRSPNGESAPSIAARLPDVSGHHVRPAQTAASCPGADCTTLRPPAGGDVGWALREKPPSALSRAVGRPAALLVTERVLCASLVRTESSAGSTGCGESPHGRDRPSSSAEVFSP